MKACALLNGDEIFPPMLAAIRGVWPQVVDAMNGQTVDWPVGTDHRMAKRGTIQITTVHGASRAR